MISVLILTFNEELNLGRCLDSVNWSDDVLVLDSFSTDRTGGDRQSQRRACAAKPFADFAAQRNFGLAQGDLKHEMGVASGCRRGVTPELQRELAALAAEGTTDAKKDGYRLASKMMFQGRWLKYSGLYPVIQVSLRQPRPAALRPSWHGQREALEPARVGTVREPLLHYSFSKECRTGWSGTTVIRRPRQSGFCKRAASQSGTGAGLLGARRAVAARSGTFPGGTLPAHAPVYLHVLVRLGFWMAGRLDVLRLLAMYEYLIVLKIRESGTTKQKLGKKRIETKKLKAGGKKLTSLKSRNLKSERQDN